nr:integrase, catalytic region, zinc finger, CCHC-type, peptidase aspartic, catalytic [Tanacetum cinerariifolium]
MSTQQDIYAAGFENRPPMHNKENYVPWSSRLLWYDKSRPNGKLIHNSIINGPYVRRMIPEPGDTNREVPVNETFHVQTDDELAEKELKQIEVEDQAIQTILLGLPEDIYAAVDSFETAQEIWLRVQQMMKGSDIRIQEKKAKLFNEWERFASNDKESIESYYHHFLKLMNDLKRNKHFPEKIASNLKFLNNLQPEWSRHVTIVHQTKDLHTADYTQLYDFLKYNQNEVDELKAERLTKTQDPLALMANSNNPYALLAPHQDQPTFNQNYMQQPMPNPKDIIDPTTAMNMSLVLMAKAFKLNYSTLTNNNQRISSNPRNRQIAQPSMNMGQDRQMQMVGVAAADLEEIEEVNANCILMASLQQASTSGTQTDKAPVYDSNGSAEVHDYENCNDNEIFNMFTQEDQYTELLEPIHESHQVPQNDSNVISEGTSVEQSWEIVEQHPANVEETRSLYDSLYQNLAIKVEKVNTVNLKLKETNTELTTELARFKNQEKCFEISQEKYDKLKRCYQQSVFQEQYLNKQLSKEKSTVSFLLEEKKKLKSDFKTHEDELLDKQIQLKKKIKELDNILVKMGQSIHMLSPKPDSFYHTKQKMTLGYQNPFYLKQAQKKQQSLYNGKVLLEKHDPPIVHDAEETLQLAQESHQKMKQLNKEIKPANYTKINHLSGVFVSQTAKSREELYFSKASKMANVSKSIPNEEFLDDTTPSVARKFLNEVKSTIVTLQRVVKHRMTLETHNWSSSAHQELHKIVKDENFPIVNQVDARVQNFEIQFLKEAAKFVGDFISLVKEADESLAKHKAIYKNLFDFISVSRTQTKTIIASLQNELQNTIYENAKLRAQLFKKVYVQKDNTHGTSKNTKFAKQSILGKPPKVDEIHALSKSVTSNSVPTPQESKVVKNDKVISSGMFRINLFKTSKEEKHVPNTVRASARTKPITVSQPHVITKKDVNSDSNGLSSTGIDNTKTRRPQPRSNTKDDRVPSASKSSQRNNKEVEVIQICLWCVDSGCSKHMTGNLNLLINFVWMFMGTVRFGNDHVAIILGFGDLQWGNILIIMVYFIDGVGHNLFSVGQFCDSDLEVAFRRNACFVRNLEGVDLLKGDRSTNLYTINLHDMASASPICLMARASSTKSWSWHQRLFHLNFDTINDLAKNDLVLGLPKFKYHKEHLCPLCEQGKSKRAYHPPKLVPNSRQRLHLLYIDLCCPMRIASINGKRYVLPEQFSEQLTIDHQ